MANMSVSKNNGTPKSSILMGFSIINQELWRVSLFLETSIYRYQNPLGKKIHLPTSPLGLMGPQMMGTSSSLGLTTTSCSRLKLALSAAIMLRFREGSREVSGIGWFGWKKSKEWWNKKRGILLMVQKIRRITFFELGSLVPMIYDGFLKKHIHSTCEIKMFLLALKVDFYSMGVLDLKSKQQADG